MERKVFLAFIALNVFVGVIAQTTPSTLTMLAGKVWDFLYFDGDDDEEDVKVELFHNGGKCSCYL